MENKQANDFLEKTGTSFKAVYLGTFPYFDGDKKARDVYQITLTRKNKSYSFRFGQSIANSRLININKSHYYPPTASDVLTCLQKYDIRAFSDFCNDFGYDTDSRKAEKIYFDVKEEYKNVNLLFSDVMEELQEIR